MPQPLSTQSTMKPAVRGAGMLMDSELASLLARPISTAQTSQTMAGGTRSSNINPPFTGAPLQGMARMPHSSARVMAAAVSWGPRIAWDAPPTRGAAGPPSCRSRSSVLRALHPAEGREAVVLVQDLHLADAHEQEQIQLVLPPERR